MYKSVSFYNYFKDISKERDMSKKGTIATIQVYIQVCQLHSLSMKTWTFGIWGLRTNSKDNHLRSKKTLFPRYGGTQKI